MPSGQEQGKDLLAWYGQFGRDLVGGTCPKDVFDIGPQIPETPDSKSGLQGLQISFWEADLTSVLEISIPVLGCFS